MDHPLDIRLLDSIDQCDPELWDSLFNSSYPFLKHRFLSLLERSGSVSEMTGWQPSHLLLTDQEQVVAAMPLYLKSHSWGEYVFDWSWAEAYEQKLVSYYPKLLSAVPFTPAIGPRLGLAHGRTLDEVAPQLLNQLQLLARKRHISGWHLLFPEPPLIDALKRAGCITRSTIQYLWENRGYASFDDFLDALASRKRKGINRERSEVRHLGLQVRRLCDEEITPEWWSFFCQVYRNTYLKHSGNQGYLTQAFFQKLGETMRGQVMLAVAERGEQKIAAALFFHDDENLYGRYWGCVEEHDYLHFELCYYQGIEFAIERKLPRFDAGAQGEHKVRRGFVPREILSVHWIKHPEFSSAISRYVAAERRYVLDYIQEACGQLPYKAP